MCVYVEKKRKKKKKPNSFFFSLLGVKQKIEIDLSQ